MEAGIEAAFRAWFGTMRPALDEATMRLWAAIEVRARVGWRNHEAQLKLVPYGSYDVPGSEAWVIVGIAHRTMRLIGNSIRQWWRCMRQSSDNSVTPLYANIDGGWSGGSRNQNWRHELHAHEGVPACLDI